MNFFCVGGECFRFMPDDNTDYLRQRASAYRSSYHYLYHYCKRWARAYTVLHLSRRLTRGDRRLGSAPLHSGPFIHGSLISQSLCFNSEDEKCLYVPYLHCFCSDLLYSFNVLVSLIIAILKLLAVLFTLNNGELFIESARLARKAAYFRSLSCTTAFLKYLWYQVNFHKYL